jgi:hypothetical protein
VPVWLSDPQLRVRANFPGNDLAEEKSTMKYFWSSHCVGIGGHSSFTPPEPTAASSVLEAAKVFGRDISLDPTKGRLAGILLSVAGDGATTHTRCYRP